MLQELGNHLWQSTLFAGLVWLMCCWCRHEPARVRYWLWWIASLKFLLPFSLLAAAGRQLAGAAAIGGIPETWTVTAELMARPFATAAPTASPGLLLLMLWAGGALALTVNWLAAAANLRRIVARAEPGQPVRINGQRQLDVRHTAERIEPGIVGIVHPVLLLPRDIDARLAPERYAAVLAHELGHVGRRDNLTAACHRLVETVFWFHPLIWWIGARLIDERERACDELVVAAGHDRETYAASILDVCEHYSALPVRAGSGISGSDLKRRVTRIMRYQGMNTVKRSRRIVLALAGAAAVALPLLSGLTGHNAAFAQAPAQPAFPPSTFPPSPFDGPNAEYLPIVKVAPIYPPAALARGIEGHVVVEYTVTADGSTDNIRVRESSSTLFEQAAIVSAAKYKYRPRMRNNVPVAVDGVATRLEFDLGDDELPVNPDAQAAAAAGESDSSSQAGTDTIRISPR